MGGREMVSILEMLENQRNVYRSSFFAAKRYGTEIEKVCQDQAILDLYPEQIRMYLRDCNGVDLISWAECAVDIYEACTKVFNEHDLTEVEDIKFLVGERMLITEAVQALQKFNNSSINQFIKTLAKECFLDVELGNSI